MRKLLSADFIRLWKNKVFWIGCAVMAAIACWMVMLGYGSNERSMDASITLNRYLFEFAPMIGGACAVVVGLFLGTDYSDGTIRNKLIVGCTRTQVYLSNLIVCTAAGLLLAASNVLSVFAFGLPMLGLTPENIIYFLLAIGVVLSSAAICTLIGMLNQNKAGAAILSLLIFLVLLFIGSYIYNALCEPEMISGAMITANGIVQGEPEPNPAYVQADIRAIYGFILDVLPTGQGIQIANREAAHPVRMAACTALTVLGTTAVGLYAFRKKDVK